MVAWLHEVLEHTSISEQALLAEGLSREGLRALRLLTRHGASRSDAIYLAHVEMIGRASGPGADIARTVKRADLADRALNPPSRPDGWSPPYDLGLQILRDEPPPATHAARARQSRGRAQNEPRRDAAHQRRSGPELRAERLGSALRNLAADLVDERRKVARLRREIAALRAQLEIPRADARRRQGLRRRPRSLAPRTGSIRPLPRRRDDDGTTRSRCLLRATGERGFDPLEPLVELTELLRRRSLGFRGRRARCVSAIRTCS